MAGVNNDNNYRIKELFEEALVSFPAERKMFYSGTDRPRVVSKYVSHEIIVNQLPALLRAQTKLPENKYLIQGSISTGNISEVPWICLFDLEISASAQRGYYIVFLIQANMKGVYISLNQGFTEYKNLHGPKKAITAIRKMQTNFNI